MSYNNLYLHVEEKWYGKQLCQMYVNNYKQPNLQILNPQKQLELLRDR